MFGSLHETDIPVYNTDSLSFSMRSGFCRNVDEICGLLRYYAASNGNPLLTFRDSVLVPSSRVKKSKKLPGLLDP
jgi:hypothetical protein